MATAESAGVEEKGCRTKSSGVFSLKQLEALPFVSLPQQQGDCFSSSRETVSVGRGCCYWCCSSGRVCSSSLRCSSLLLPHRSLCCKKGKGLSFWSAAGGPVALQILYPLLCSTKHFCCCCNSSSRQERVRHSACRVALNPKQVGAVSIVVGATFKGLGLRV